MAKASGKDTSKIMKDEIKYMQKGGAPKSLIAHEKAEHAHMKEEKGEAYANGGCVKGKKMANGGMVGCGGIRSAQDYRK